MESMVSLFLSQSYRDAWEDYIRSLNKPNFVRWDYIILTASNEQQAEGFRSQIEERRRLNLLPQKAKEFYDGCLVDVRDKVYTRDLFGRD